MAPLTRPEIRNRTIAAMTAPTKKRVLLMDLIGSPLGAASPDQRVADAPAMFVERRRCTRAALAEASRPDASRKHCWGTARREAGRACGGTISATSGLHGDGP